MRPLIAPGTWMLVEFGARPHGTGEIVVVSVGHTIVAHRVVRTLHRETGTFVITKGDAEARCDSATRVDDVIGVVRALRRVPDGHATTLGCAGPSARMLARVSRSSGGFATRARRLAPFLPVPLRRLAGRAVLALTRTATTLVAAPLASAARLQTASHERR